MLELLTLLAACTSPDDTKDTGDGTPAIWTSVSPGTHMSCGTDSRGALHCWGDDDALTVTGDTADWTAYDVDNHPAVADAVEVHLARMSAQDSDGFGCVRDAAGNLTCWGRTASNPEPTDTFTSFDAGENYLCGITDAGTVSCWTNLPAEVPNQQWAPGGTIVSLRAGANSACFESYDHAFVCTVAYDSEPWVVPVGIWSTVVPGTFYSMCGLSTAGDISCWDYQGNEDTRLTPPTDRAPYSAVCVSDEWACALDADGYPECFGEPNPFYPWDVPVPTDVQFTSLDCGAYHACGLTAEGQAVCFGNDSYGQSSVPEL